MTTEPEHPHPGGHVVLVGDDDLGVRVLQELRELGVTVTAVCAQPDAPFARAARGAEVTLVVGDPEHEDTLREAGVEGASTCGLLANADLANVHTALELQELAPRARLPLPPAPPVQPAATTDRTMASRHKALMLISLIMVLSLEQV